MGTSRTPPLVAPAVLRCPFGVQVPRIGFEPSLCVCLSLASARSLSRSRARALSLSRSLALSLSLARARARALSLSLPPSLPRARARSLSLAKWQRLGFRVLRFRVEADVAYVSHVPHD